MPNLSEFQITRLTMDDVIDNSFKDYHVKGFDYLCLHRSAERTVKLYFFDGDVSKMPEVVNPHDHRYDFTTFCIAGSVHNFKYKRNMLGRLRMNRFEYRTKLNGGDGFTWIGDERLSKISATKYGVGNSYFSEHDTIHTIRLGENETILCLIQYEDRIPIGGATSTYCVGNEPPSLSGLYNRFTPDQITTRLRQLSERASIDIVLSEHAS